MLFSQNSIPVDSDKALPNERYLIKGHLINSQGKKIFLIEKDFFKETIFKDSVIADGDGNFEFAGKLTEPAFCNLEIDGINANFEFILENSVVKINGDADKIYAATIEGSKEEDVRKLCNAFWNSDSLRTIFGNLEKLKNEAEVKQDTVAMNSVDIQFKKAISNNNVVIEGLIKKYPYASASINSAGAFANTELEKADSLIRFYESSPVKNYEQVKYFRRQINLLKTLAIGSIAPDFAQNDTSKKVVKLPSFGGKYVLLDFWASWCIPCREESPYLVMAQNRFGKVGFTIVSVSCDSDKKIWINAIHQDQLTWTHLSDLNGWENQVARLYAVTSIPRNFLLNPEGKIIAKNLRGNDLSTSHKC